MRADRSGIECNKEELTALLAFAGDDTNFGVVRFRVNANGKLVVAASDGKRAVEHTANAGDAAVGEWSFDRTFIEALRRQTDKGETVAVIQADNKKAKAIFRGVESTAERAEIKCPTTAFSTQVSIDAVHETVVGKNIAERDRLDGTWFAFNPAFVTDLDKVSKAANGCPLSIIPPTDPAEMVRFSASSERGTWRGCFKPTVVIAPGEEAETETDPDAPGSDTQGLPSSAPPALELTNQLGTAKKRKARGSKEPAAKKKTASKRPAKSTPAPADDDATDSDNDDAAEAG
jgi:ferredoxin